MYFSYKYETEFKSNLLVAISDEANIIKYFLIYMRRHFF